MTSQLMVTIRVKKEQFQAEWKKAYMVYFPYIEGKKVVFFPKSITTKKDNIEHGTIDFDCPGWFARQEHIEDESIAEYYED